MNIAVLSKVEAFFGNYTLKHFDGRQILIHAGEDPKGIIYLQSGQVRQYDITERGDEVVVNVFKPPAFFPMLWAINKSPNEYFYETVGKVEARVAPVDEALSFIKQNPDVVYDLLSRLYSGVEGMQRRMAHLMGGSSRSRVLFELALECRRFGVKGRDGSFALMIREEELAKRCGLARETVSRELAELKKNHIIEVNYNHFVVKDLNHIEAELGTRL